jgi:hypothetical protein
LVESHKWDPRPLDEDPRPIEAKLRWHLHGTILERNSISSNQKMGSRESSWFGEPRCKLGSKVVSSIVFHCFSRVFFHLFLKLKLCKNGKHSWMQEDIVECIPTIPFLSTSNVGTVGFVDPHKVVAQRHAFFILGNVQNDGVLELRIKSFGHAWLRHSFSQVEGDLDL